MLAFLERLKVLLLVNLTWRLSRLRMVGSLRLFAATEADSAWQLAYVAQRTDDPATRAELFGQILEETKHAAEFTRLCRELQGGLVATARFERKALYPAAKDLWKFHAYCQIGEHAAAERFKHIHDATREPSVRRVLKRILRDEAQHVHSATEMLAGVGDVSAAEQRTELRRIRVRRAWEAWLRSGRNIADVFGTALLSVAYVVVGPLGVMAARKRMRAPAPVAQDVTQLAAPVLSQSGV